MNYSARKEAELKKRIIPQTKKADFEEFWQREVAHLRTVPIHFERRLLTLPYKTMDAYEITFNTHDDTVVTAYFCVPKTEQKQGLPCVAVFHGGGGMDGIFPEIVATGVCTFSMDTRSQGGKTYDRAQYDVMDDYRGALMTHGVLDKSGFYMKNIYLDAVRTIDVIASLPEVDASRIVAYGCSQGGALSIVAAALSGKVKKAYPTVPSYACLERRVEAGSGVFGATKNVLWKHPEHTDTVMDTLSYFDINNMVSLLTVPTAFFLGLTDPTCIPEFVYSPYAHTTAPKSIVLSPFTPHAASTAYKRWLHEEFSRL